MSFPDPVDVAKIAALLRKNEGWYETIDEAYAHEDTFQFLQIVGAPDLGEIK